MRDLLSIASALKANTEVDQFLSPNFIKVIELKS